MCENGKPFECEVKDLEVRDAAIQYVCRRCKREYVLQYWPEIIEGKCSYVGRFIENTKEVPAMILT